MQEITPSKKEKPKLNKAILIINIVALVIILAVVGFMVYDKFIKAKQGPGFGPGGRDFSQMNIEDICKMQTQRPINNEQTPLNDNFKDQSEQRGTPPDDIATAEIDKQRQLIEEICADGQVSVEEKQQFEDSSN